MFNSIIKPKKSKLPSAKKVAPSEIGSIKTMVEMEKEHGKEEMMPKEKYETSEKKESYSKPKSEKMALIDMKMQKYKKKK